MRNHIKLFKVTKRLSKKPKIIDFNHK